MSKVILTGKIKEVWRKVGFEETPKQSTELVIKIPGMPDFEKKEVEIIAQVVDKNEKV